MSKTNSTDLIELASNELGLPYSPGQYGGTHRIMIGLWRLCVIKKKDSLAIDLKNAIESLRGAPDKLPNQRCDPLGFLLGAAPLYDYTNWCASKNQLAIEHTNDFFNHLISEHLDIVIATCKSNNVGSLLPKLDATLAHRLWQQTIFITALAPYKSNLGSCKPIRQQALNAIANSGRRNIHAKINSNWKSPIINRRKGRTKTLKDLYKKLEVSDPSKIFGRWVNWTPTQKTRLTQEAKKAGLRSFGDIYIVRPEGDFGPGHFKDLVDSSRENEPGSASLAMVLAGFVKPEERTQWQIKQCSQCAVIQTTLNPRTSYKDWPDKFHFPEINAFERSVPLEIWNRFNFHCSSLATHQLMEEYQKFLRRICPFATPLMVERFICSQAPMIFRLPRTFGAFGFGKKEIKASGGWADYARHEPKTAVMNGKLYFEILTDKFEAMRQVSLRLRSCGSSAGLPDDLAKSIFGSLATRLKNPSILNDPVILAAHWNGTMALLGLATQALQFRRPYPFLAPPIHALYGMGCQVVKEKVGPRIIRMGPILRHLFGLAAQSLPIVCQKLMPSDACRTLEYCCGFFKLPLPKVVHQIDAVFKKQNIIEGLSYDKTLFEYKEIYPGTMRHTADFALRQAGFTDREIDILTDHSSTRSRSRYSRACLDEPVEEKLHTRAEKAVAEYIGVA